MLLNAFACLYPPYIMLFTLCLYYALYIMLYLSSHRSWLSEQYEWMQHVLPVDGYKIATGRLFVSVTVLTPTGLKNKLISDFYCNRDLIDACMASSCLPYLTERGWYRKFRGEYVWDGGVSSPTRCCHVVVLKYLLFYTYDISPDRPLLLVFLTLQRALSLPLIRLSQYASCMYTLTSPPLILSSTPLPLLVSSTFTSPPLILSSDHQQHAGLPGRHSPPARHPPHRRRVPLEAAREPARLVLFVDVLLLTSHPHLRSHRHLHRGAGAPRRTANGALPSGTSVSHALTLHPYSYLYHLRPV